MNIASRLALLLGLITLTAHAQTPPPDTPRAIISPEVAEWRVTFRLRAPQAREVVLRGEWNKEPSAMAKDDQGVWTVTAEAVPAGVWEYSFSVDGLNVIDPANPTLKPGRSLQRSILQIPATPPALWDWQDVPHGTVHQHGYQSKALGRPRELWIYTPPGYERGEKKLPVLVLQHGSGDNQRAWVEAGKAHWILDNLIAQGKARPMVIAMLDGHSLGAWPRGSDAGKREDAMQAFQRELFEDALPLVESLYRVETDAAHLAITGLSMGGAQSLAVGLGNLDRFAWIGSFSGVPPEAAATEKFLAAPDVANAKLKLLWIAVGRDDFLRQRNEEFVAALKEKGIHHTWQLSEGAHAWPVWRQHLAEFAPLLFTDAK